MLLKNEENSFCLRTGVQGNETLCVAGDYSFDEIYSLFRCVWVAVTGLWSCVVTLCTTHTL